MAGVERGERALDQAAREIAKKFLRQASLIARYGGSVTTVPFAGHTFAEASDVPVCIRNKDGKATVKVKEDVVRPLGEFRAQYAEVFVHLPEADGARGETAFYVIDSKGKVTPDFISFAQNAMKPARPANTEMFVELGDILDQVHNQVSGRKVPAWE